MILSEPITIFGRYLSKYLLQQIWEAEGVLSKDHTSLFYEALPSFMVVSFFLLHSTKRLTDKVQTQEDLFYEALLPSQTWISPDCHTSIFDPALDPNPLIFR